MTPAALIAWRERLGLTQQAAADSLGCSKRSIHSYETGKAPVPKIIALAAASVEQATKKRRTS